jgi:hypothetical protein
MCDTTHGRRHPSRVGYAPQWAQDVQTALTKTDDDPGNFGEVCFARRQATPLEIIPVLPPADLPFLPFVYDISMGVRKGDEALRAELDTVLERRRAEIDHILDNYGVPRLIIAPSSSAP